MIEFDNVAFDYGGGALLTQIGFSLAPGSFQFLTGPSGAGKTTLLKLLSMHLVPRSGSARVFGQDVREMDRDAVARARRRLGVVHQDCQFIDHLTLAENVALPLTVAGRAAAAGAAEVGELLAWVGLSAQADALPPALSGGERQRAALARAVVTSPDVILADEPTGNIDWEMSLRLLALLVELNRLGKAVIVATHDMNLIRAAKAQVQARVLRLAGGRLQAAGADL